MLKKLRRLFLSDIFLTFSGQTAFAAGEGKVFAIPARLLVELPSYKIIAFGQEAREVEHAGLGRSGIVLPCRDTEISDERGAEAFLRSLFRVVLGSGFILKPRVWLSLPERTTPFMKEVWTGALFSAGARDVVLVHPLLAIAAGAALPSQSPHGYMVGNLSEEGISLGLVAFGHVQQEEWHAFLPDQSEKERLAIFREVWQHLLETVPPEFLGTLQQEGVLLCVPDDSVELAKLYSQQLGVPVGVVERPVEVLGLRRLAQEANG